jgi:LacI family transcriptional regulator
MGLQSELTERDYASLISVTRGKEVLEAKFLRLFRQKRAEGLFIMCGWGKMKDTPFVELMQDSYPMVFIDQYPTDFEVDYVSSDNFGGTFAAGQHLIELGHRRVGFLGLYSSPEAITALERVRGLREAMSRVGGEVVMMDEEVFGQETNDETQRTNPYEVTSRFLRAQQEDKAITAIVALHDLIAFMACNAVRGFGLRIPEDISVVGFDGSGLIPRMEPGLTTVRQDWPGMGRKAVDVLLNRIEKKGSSEPTQIHLPAELVVRTSTGPAPA